MLFSISYIVLSFSAAILQLFCSISTVLLYYVLGFIYVLPGLPCGTPLLLNSFTYSFFHSIIYSWSDSSIEMFLKSCNELLNWISTKSNQLSDGHVGTNQEKIRALQRKHQVKFFVAFIFFS